MKMFLFSLGVAVITAASCRMRSRFAVEALDSCRALPPRLL